MIKLLYVGICTASDQQVCFRFEEKKLLKSGYLSEKYFQPVGEVLDLVDGEVDVVEHREAHRAPIAQGQVHLVTAGTSSNNNRYI